MQEQKNESQAPKNEERKPNRRERRTAQSITRKAVRKSKKTKRGFTLAELMGVIAIVSIVFVGVFATSCSGSGQRNAAKQEATQWAKELNLELTGISCADYDSDGDGYVSCTLAMKGGETKQIECRGAYSIGHGCRDPKISIQGNSR
jgi:prepilin-type N-terminal cleavage/methylation domain-containing protein